MFYDQPLKVEMANVVWEARMFEMGHSLEYLRSMPMEDRFALLGYWSEKNRAEQKLQAQRTRKPN